MVKKILESNLTRVFLFSFIYVSILAFASNKPFNTMDMGLWLYMFLPSPLYFAIYGGVRQGLYKNKHRPIISTFIVMGTTIVIWSVYFIADFIIRNGIDNVYWSWLIDDPGYVLLRGILPAMGFCIGSLIVKVVQHFNHAKTNALDT